MSLIRHESSDLDTGNSVIPGLRTLFCSPVPGSGSNDIV